MAGRAGSVGPTIAPYGTWPSSISLDLLAVGRVYPSTPLWADGEAWWEEPRPQEGGRQLVRHRRPDGSIVDAVPRDVNVRTMAHEYGGGAWTVAAGVLYYSNVADGRLYRIRPDGQPEALTIPDALRYADLAVDEGRGRLLCVCEDHRAGEAAVVDRLVSIDLEAGPAAPRAIVEGADFYAAPRLSPDGRRLAWLSWSHPNMPWDGMDLWLADLDDEGAPGPALHVAGGPDLWVTQPRWSATGDLYFVGEPTGRMNLYRLRSGTVEPVLPMAADFARPDWIFGLATFACLDDGGVLAVGRSDARDQLWRVDAAGDVRAIGAPYDEIDALAADGERVLLVGDSAADAGGLLELDLGSGGATTIVPSLAVSLDPAVISSPRAITFPTSAGGVAHALFYPPRNDAWTGPPDERPPLIVTSHGGPTAGTGAGLRLSTQYFTSRGLALVDVDYRGSSGYGRDYRQALEGQWGVYDMDDCAAAAAYLAAQGLVDGARVAIRGASASGYTTLCALTFRDDFRAGVSYFGIGDLETFARDTHRFESRYLERLVGPYPAMRALYEGRSPIHFLDRLSCPVLILQGLDDRVVPPSQAEDMVAALEAKGLPYAYLPFEGEGHGFRRAENVRRATEAELAFYGQVFGFQPADALPPLDLVVRSAPHAQGVP